MGGQAVLEGVMMRGATTWVVAVRMPDGSIDCSVNDVAGWSEKYRNIPIVRGVMGLGESLSLGYRALAWSAERQLRAEEAADNGTPVEASGAAGDSLSGKALKTMMLVALVFFTAVFLIVPALAGRAVAHRLPLPFQASEALVRLGFFIGYLALVGMMRDIQRVYQYHGAEHKAIAAYENGVELSPEAAQQFTTAHVRCGTNFLLTVMLVAILVYSVVPTPNIWAVIASRIVLIPVIAGLSYEVIRLAAANIERPWVRAAMRPGLLMQKLTTREPSLDQLEVAIASLRACMTDEQLTEVDARAA
jgi:uncharacterized protein YqhQ